MNESEQHYMERLFRDWKSFPKNSLTPCLINQGGHPVVVFLIMAEEDVIRTFFAGSAEQAPEADIFVTRPEHEGEGLRDLVLQFEITSAVAGTTAFRSVIPGDETDKQASMCKALLQVNRVGVFIATNDFQFKGFQAYGWDGAANPKIREILEEGIAE